MDPRLLRHYKDELGFVKQLAAEFAAEYPKIAGRLGMDGFEVADPYVERLLEGFAFLTARVQLELDSGYQRFTQHLLESVLPNCVAPLPSLAMVRFVPAAEDPALAGGPELARGTGLRSLLGKGDQTACEYRTAQPVRLWPIECKDASYIGSTRDLATLKLPAIDPLLVPAIGNVRAGIRLRLSTVGKAVWGKLPIESLPLYLVGADDTPFQLYEQLLANTVAAVLRPAGDRPAWHEIVAGGAVQPLGFSDDEALLPADPRGFQGFRLLREYFAFPQRFRFADLRGLARATARAGDLRDLEVVLLLDRADARLQNNIDARNFVPFCTPAVNLFAKTCDRIHLDPTENRYHIVPDRTRPLDFEIHSVSSVVGHGGADQPEQEFRPLYHTDDFARRGQDQRYFVPERRPRKLPEARAGGARTAYVGSELFLTLVDGDQAPHDPGLKQLSVRALCSNRDLPLAMPVGLRETDFTLDSGAFVHAARCLGRPTAPRPSVADGETAWRLIDHLSLNYLSLTDAGAQGAVALRELLGLYADLGERTDRKQIQGLRSVRSEPVVRRLPTDGPLAFGRGLHIELLCEENEFQGSSVYLLGAVLEQFFARYVSINSFTETVLHTVERGEIARWPPRTGTRHLL